jgi:bacteriorhodopsin
MEPLSYGQYSLVYNAFSFVLAAMGAATIFLFISRSQVASQYRTAVTLSGIVTVVALYHYFRIFNSWTEAYSVLNNVVTVTGRPFNDAYRYMDWLVTVPLLVTELVLVMRLPGKVGPSKATKLAVLGLSMIPFLIIQYELFVGLKSAIALQPESSRGMVSTARYITVVTWFFYPIVFILPMIGLTGAGAVVGVQVGYSIADVLAKAAFGIFIYNIAVAKTQGDSVMAVSKL